MRYDFVEPEDLGVVAIVDDVDDCNFSSFTRSSACNFVFKFCTFFFVSALFDEEFFFFVIPPSIWKFFDHNIFIARRKIKENNILPFSSQQ